MFKAPEAMTFSTSWLAAAGPNSTRWYEGKYPNMVSIPQTRIKMHLLRTVFKGRA